MPFEIFHSVFYVQKRVAFGGFEMLNGALGSFQDYSSLVPSDELTSVNPILGCDTD